MESAPKKPSLKAKLIERMHEPLQLRVAVCVALVAAWYSMGYSPVRDRINASTAKLDRDRKRLALATEVESLRKEAAKFADRLPPRSDPNEFLQYVLGGVRSGPLKLVSLIPDKPKDAGPFQVATVRVELEGEYEDVAAFLRWVEGNKRLLRVDTLKVDPDSRDPGTLKVLVSVLGLMGVEQTAKSPSKPEPKSKTKPKPKDAAPKGEPPAAKPEK